MIGRRRFLAIAASFAATPALAQRHSWTGRAFGAAASIDLHGPTDAARAALDQALRTVRDVERLFSLYDSTSVLSYLNKVGQARVPQRFVALMHIADVAYEVTDGLFDPTVQPLWHALATGRDVMAARKLVGWDRVQMRGGHVQLAPGQALTFNGIAQGFATDLVAGILKAHGFERSLVNIGEYRALGGPWRLGVEDPVYGRLGTRTINTVAIATSSPLASPIGPEGHIVHTNGHPLWSTVSVEAETAAMADALSTGLVLADLERVRQVRQMRGVQRITLIDKNGDLVTL